MDKTVLIDKLNEILRAEYAGLIQYTQFSFVVRGQLREVYHEFFRENGEEALGLADSYAGTIDLLVTDVILPGRRGSELALEFLAKHPGSHALLISGFTRDAELSTLPPERTRVLTKPFTFQTLEKTLRALLPNTGVDGAAGRG